MKERLYAGIWRLGARVRNLARRIGILGPFERFLIRLGLFLVPLPKKEVVVTLPLGMTMVVPAGFPSARTYAAGLYEPAVTELFQRIVSQGMGVVDLGANVGYHTLLLSQLVSPSGRVYAFEPDPIIYAALIKNIKLNGCRNVAAVCQAVANSTGSMTLVRDPYGCEGILTNKIDDKSKGDRLTVQTVALDHFFAAQGWPTIDLIKLDIEGSEKAALEGMRELSRRSPHLQLIMELNWVKLSQASVTREALGLVLQELGFSHGYIIERGLMPCFVAHGLPKSSSVYNLLIKKECL